MTEYVQRTMVKAEVPSRHLGLSRSIKIYLPPGYNELLSYPVVYCQDGNEFFTMGRIATIANRLILEEGMDPVIIVGVSVDRSRRTSEYSPAGLLNPVYKRFFVEELVPFVEERYPIRQDPGARILAGDSLGGTVSLHLALDHPALFSRVLSLSGAFFRPTIERIHQEQDLSRLSIWMVVGLDETAVETHIGTFDFVDWNRQARTALETRGARLSYEEKPGRHIWGFWQQVLPDGLCHFLLRSPYE